MLEKLAEISPCYNNEDSFTVGGIAEQKTCDWFGQKPSRCDTYGEGQLECSRRCARGCNNSAC